jgi:pimeloyl-ACP methyl ester carboxylesterase
MGTFAAADGTQLTYHVSGTGEPVICVPGGPMRASVYLGDLGGLTAHRRLVLLDLRGTGDSAEPADRSSYRCDRQIDDVEALRTHLGLDTIDLLTHSGGAALAVRYAARHPQRIQRLVLVCPSPRVVGVEVSDGDRREIAQLRRDEAWFPPAYAAFGRLWAGEATDADFAAIAPFMHGRWDSTAAAQEALTASQRNAVAAAAYYGDGALDPPATRAALAQLTARVLLLAGGYDVQLPPNRAAEYAGLFPNATVAVQPGAGHSPWLDDPEWFTRTVAGFLR